MMVCVKSINYLVDHPLIDSNGSPWLIGWLHKHEALLLDVLESEKLLLTTVSVPLPRESRHYLAVRALLVNSRLPRGLTVCMLR